MGFNDDYVQVNKRIEEFYKAFPSGSIQSEIVELTEKRVTVKSMAYRTADDQRPGIGHSWMNVPGTTNFTRGSELENTETSAVGRAIAMLGFEVKKSVASAEEVASKSGVSVADTGSGTNSASSPRVGLTDKQRGLLMATYGEVGLKGAQRTSFQFSITGKHKAAEMTSADLDKLLTALADPAQVAAAITDFAE